MVIGVGVDRFRKTLNDNSLDDHMGTLMFCGIGNLNPLNSNGDDYASALREYNEEGIKSVCREIIEERHAIK